MLSAVLSVSLVKAYTAALTQTSTCAVMCARARMHACELFPWFPCLKKIISSFRELLTLVMDGRFHNLNKTAELQLY